MTFTHGLIKRSIVSKGTDVINRLIEFVSLKILAPIRFDRIVFLFTGRYYNLTPADRDACKDLMERGHYVWLNRRKTHLTTYLISCADFALGVLKWAQRKGRFPRLNFARYTHAFINVTDDLLIEAIGRGVVESYFDECFDCDWACALRVRGLTDAEWKRVSIAMVKCSFWELGKKYDTRFDLNDRREVSCVELIRILVVEALGVDEYARRMKALERTVQMSGNLTPHMLYESESFEIVYEVRR